MAANSGGCSGKLTKYVCIKEVVAASLTEKPRLQHNNTMLRRGHRAVVAVIVRAILKANKMLPKHRRPHNKITKLFATKHIHAYSLLYVKVQWRQRKWQETERQVKTDLLVDLFLYIKSAAIC